MSLQLGSAGQDYPKKYDSGLPTDREIKHRNKEGKDSIPDAKNPVLTKETEIKPVDKLQKNIAKSIKESKVLKETDKFIKDNQFNIPLDQLKSSTDVSRFVKDQILQQKGEVKIPQDVLDKLNIKAPAEIVSFVDELNKSEATPEKSKTKVGYNKSERTYQASYGNDKSSETLGVNDHKITASTTFSQEKEVTDAEGNTHTEKKEYSFGVDYNNGTLKKLANNTPANEQKFKDTVKSLNNTIKEKDALDFRSDLLKAESPDEQREVLEKFVKGHKSKDAWAFLNSMGLEDRSVRVKANIAGNSTELELSKEDIRATYDNAKYGGTAEVGKGSVKLRAKIDGKVQEIEVNKENFIAAFDSKEAGGRVELSKEKISLNAKVGNKTAQLELKKDEIRIGTDVGSFGGNIRAVRKRQENSEVANNNNVYTLNKEDGGGLGIKADVKKFGIKGDLDINYKTNITVKSPASADEKKMSEEEKSRLKSLAAQTQDDKAVTFETASNLKVDDTITVNYERKHKNGAGLEYQGVSTEYNFEGKKADSMTVTAIPDTENNPPHNKVKVNIKIDRENTLEGSLGGSGVKLSAKETNDNKLQVEFECDLSTDKGKEAYSNAVEGMKDGKLPIDSMSYDSAIKDFKDGYDNKNLVTRGISTPVSSHTVTKTSEEKLDIKTGIKEYNSSRTTTQKGEKVFDKEQKEVKFKGTVKSDHNLSDDATLSFKIEDQRIRKKEVYKYGDKTGLGAASLVDLKGQRNVSIDVNLKINKEHLEAISNVQLKEDAAKSEKAFMEDIKNAQTNEDKVKVVQNYIETNGQDGFSFIQSLDILPAPEVKLTGQKSEQLKPIVESSTVDKNIEESLKAKHPIHKLKEVRSKQDDVKSEADFQIEYLQQFLLDNTKIPNSDKEKIVDSIRSMLYISMNAQNNIDKINSKLESINNQ